MEHHPLVTSGLRVSGPFPGTMTVGEDWGRSASAETCRTPFDAYAGAGGKVTDTAINPTNGSADPNAPHQDEEPAA